MLRIYSKVAEMHGELMEFNEVLHRQLNLRENMLKRLQNELVDLRGPVSKVDSFVQHATLIHCSKVKEFI